MPVTPGTNFYRNAPRYPLGWLLFAALLPWMHSSRAQTQHPAAPVFSPCQIGMPDSAFHMQAKCMSLTVPEDRAKPDGKQIKLHIAVLSARASKPAPDALFFIAGGPGQASTQAFVTEAAAFDRIRANHDIVLVDQRGTGGSNRLDCPASTEIDAVPDDAEIARLAKTCLAQLKGDPRFYTTTVAVKDLDAVRAALGYEQIDVYGISYGTRMALEYLREFPSHVRSVVLDGVVPADWNVGADVSLDAQRALDGIFKRCSQQPDCNKAFPNLANEFAMLQRDLKRHPVKVAFRDPVTAMPISQTLDWDKVAVTVRLMSYSSATAALLPLLIHQAATAHDYAPLMAQALIFTNSVNEGIAEGMNAAVLCTEDVPFYAHAAEVRRAAESYLGGKPVEALIKTCAAWPRGIMAPDFKQPVVSNKPVLLISGEDDPITPPANAIHAAKTLSDSLSLVVPGQGHGNAMRGCVPKLMAQFVDKASAKGLDTHCVSTIRAFPFFINFNGPTP
jgi:pimeloyl-ACP methyl ester carboxylesterase